MSKSGGSGAAPVRGILKKKEKETLSPLQDQRKGTSEPGIQWDEMNILMTEHPEGKDYGHMKIEEPKTPYHEMAPGEEQGPSSSPNRDQLFSPEDLALKVQEASKKPLSNWEKDDDSSEDEVPETVKEHKRQFTEWRKKHYNEFHAVKRAKELMKQDEEELLALDRLEKTSMQDSAKMDDDDDDEFHYPMEEGPN